MLTFIHKSVDLILSTLGTHHSNFVATNPGQGVHKLKVTVSEYTATANSADEGNESRAAVCAGPGVVTVQQVKAFIQSGGIEVK